MILSRNEKYQSTKIQNGIRQIVKLFLKTKVRQNEKND